MSIGTKARITHNGNLKKVSTYRQIYVTFFLIITASEGSPQTVQISVRNKLAQYCSFHHFLSLAVYRNCGEVYKSGQRKDGVYTIKPDSLSAFDVFCDQTTAGGGWTVFQKRLDGSVDFYLKWSDYRVGFGDPNGEFWLGLGKIHRLTSADNSMLRVDLEDFKGNARFAQYKMFSVMSGNNKYKLKLGSYSGDSLRFLSLCLL